MSLRPFTIPATVPVTLREEFANNMERLTKQSGRMFLFAGDQKAEHLNTDFYGDKISPEDANPEHLFKIASQSPVGAFASQLGLLSEYAKMYPDIPYIVKLNARTNIIKTEMKDPLSLAWNTIEDVIQFKKNAGVSVLGVGYTIYPGSEYEPQMLQEAAQLIEHAHRHGLVTVIWAYARGKAVQDGHNPHLIAGLAGLGATLGADFVKVAPPKLDGRQEPSLLKEASLAAGVTGVVCAGGENLEVRPFLQTVHDQIHLGNAAGCATGRNIHQKNEKDAIALCFALNAIVTQDASVDEAYALFEKQSA